MLDKLLQLQSLLLTLVVVEQVYRYLAVPSVEEVIYFILLVRASVLRADRVDVDVSTLVLLD